MARLITLAHEYLQIEEEEGIFKFLNRQGWPIPLFRVTEIPAMITLLQLLQQECQAEEADARDEQQQMEADWRGTHAPGSVPPWHDTTDERMDRLEEEGDA